MTSSSPERSKLLDLSRYSLVDSLLHRRSRRFGTGMTLNGGPLAYTSPQKATPLSTEEEAALAFAACGITGFTMADLPFEAGTVPDAGGGNIMMNLVGRTVPSGDASHGLAVFVINDEGAWMLKRPQDYQPSEISALADAARRHEWLTLYERGRVKISDKRVDIPRRAPYVPPFNQWSANVPGATYFLPIAELSGFYINVLLSAFTEEFSTFLLDDRNNFQPAGLAKFGRSKGGHLYDDLKSGYVGTLANLDSWMMEFAAIEQGAILQNLGLMCAALDLGGFAHFAAYPNIWFQALGFRMVNIPFTRTVGAGPVTQILVRLTNKDQDIPMAVGLERDGEVLIKPYCPPYYRTMEEAVLAFVDRKYAAGKGIFRDGGTATAWRDGKAVQAGIPRYSDQTIAATIACCEYVYEHYGRIPPNVGPFRSVLAFQATHVDESFYEKFYRPEALR